MHIILGFLLVAFVLGILAQTVQRAREAHRGAAAPSRRGRIRGGQSGVPRGRTTARVPGAPPAESRWGTGWLEHRRRLALERVKHQNTMLRDQARDRFTLTREWARHRIRMAEREAAMPPVTVASPDAPGAPGQQGPPGSPGSPGSPGPDAPPRPPGTVPGEVITDPPAPPAAPGPAPPPGPAQQNEPSPPQPSQPGGIPVATGTGSAVEQAIGGMHHIHQRAAAGNIRAKQWAIKACAEVFIRLSKLMLMLSRTLSEAGYGPEIFEPMAQAAIYAQAAAMACGQSDTQITTLANMTVGDLADSPRQAPERRELSETGGR